MPWDQRLSVGHDGIDKQHRVLVGLLDQVAEASSDDDFEVSVSVVLDLAKYVIQHFNYEQELMNRFGYPEREAHQREHDLLVKQVQGFIDQLRSGDLSRPQLHALLLEWVQVHFAGDDRRLGVFLAGRN